MTPSTPWHLYLLECRNGHWYAGITNNLDARFAAHQAGRGAKYTRGNPPVRVLASCSYPDRASASRAEWQLKRQPRARKLAWLQATGVDARAPLEIRAGGLDQPRVIAWLHAHPAAVALHSPPESIHALDLSGLRAPGVEFWSVWRGDALAGCGALKHLGDGHGELKSMRTDVAHLRQGVASALLVHLMAIARARDWQRLSLETGSADAFAPAHALYARHGFVPCAPFGDYSPDPCSIFLTRALDD